jgi:phospholipid transport system substrate-binding protein
MPHLHRVGAVNKAAAGRTAISAFFASPQYGFPGCAADDTAFRPVPDRKPRPQHFLPRAQKHGRTYQEKDVQNLIIRCALLATLTLAGPFASAQDVAPDALLKTVTSDVIAVIKQDKALAAGNPAQLADLVESKILPHFDFVRMTELATARNWQLATPEQQKALTAEFRTLLVRTYSMALKSYRDQIIEFRPALAVRGDGEVTVKSVVKHPGSDPVTMDYDMEKTAEGWKVYEIKIDGVNLIANYRQTFAAKVRDGGFDGLIKALAEKNR